MEFFFLLQLNRPTSFASSSTSELNGFVDNNQLSSVFTASLNPPSTDKDSSSKSPHKEAFTSISFKLKENQISASPNSNSKYSSPVNRVPPTTTELKSPNVDSATNSSVSANVSAKTDVTSPRIGSRNFSFDNKEIVSVKNRRVSLCVSDTLEHEPTLLETRRASSPFTNGGTELLIGPHDECRLKTTAIIEGLRRSQRDFNNR